MSKLTEAARGQDCTIRGPICNRNPETVVAAHFRYKALAFTDTAIKNAGGSWFNVAHNTTSGNGRNPDGRKGPGGSWLHGNRDHPSRMHSSKSPKRKLASAMIAKIPPVLARYIAHTYFPTEHAKACEPTKQGD